MFWLFITQTLVFSGVTLTEVINAVYARDVLLISEAQWWLVFIPLLLVTAIASIPVGKMIDKVGRKIPMFIGIFTWSVAIVLFINGNLLTVTISMCLLGVSTLLMMAGAQALLADLVHIENRGKVNGFINFVGYIVSALGMFLGNYFYATFLPQLPFYVSLGLIVPAFIILLFLVHEPKKRIGDIQSLSARNVQANS